MIIGIGTDIIEIDRIKKAIENNKNFLGKVFTIKEIEMFQKRNMRFEVIAGNFAAKEAIENNKNFLGKVFTIKEIEMFQKRNMRFEVIAGNFAAKEAISKAIGSGVRGFSLLDIQILRDELGKPIAYLSNNIDKFIKKNYTINISISHNKTSAIAFAVLEEI